MKKIYATLLSLAVLTPVVSFALLQGTADLLKAVRGLMTPLMYILFGVAVLYFFWGMGQFILNAGDEKTHEMGRKKMIWGVIVLFVMFSIFGIISFIGDATGITGSGSSGSVGGNCVNHINQVDGSPC